MTTSLHNVFVYGSLLSGFGNNALFPDNENSPLHAESTDDNYQLRAYSSFPAVYERSRSRHSVSKLRGEIYRVSDETFAALDQLEGHPTWYRREERKFRLLNQTKNLKPVIVTAWIYLMQGEPRGPIVEAIDGVASWRTWKSHQNSFLTHLTSRSTQV